MQVAKATVPKSLASDFLLSRELGLRAAQLIFGETILGQVLGLVEQLLFHLGGRLGGGSGVKGEATGDSPREILCTDIISQTEFFAEFSGTTREPMSFSASEIKSIAYRSAWSSVQPGIQV